MQSFWNGYGSVLVSSFNAGVKRKHDGSSKIDIDTDSFASTFDSVLSRLEDLPTPAHEWDGNALSVNTAEKLQIALWKIVYDHYEMLSTSFGESVLIEKLGALIIKTLWSGKGESAHSLTLYNITFALMTTDTFREQRDMAMFVLRQQFVILRQWAQTILAHDHISLGKKALKWWNKWQAVTLDLSAVIRGEDFPLFCSDKLHPVLAVPLHIKDSFANLLSLIDVHVCLIVGVYLI